jgi:putative flippase GtrA
MKAHNPRFRRELQRFLKFAVVGVIGAVVDFGTFNLLANLLGIASLVASILSFSAAVSSNFLWNRFWTYPDSRSKRLHQQVLQFALVSAVGLMIRTPVFAISEEPFVEFSRRILPGMLENGLPLIDILDPEMMGSNLALALAIVIVLFWNFGANRFWTYSDAE